MENLSDCLVFSILPPATLSFFFLHLGFSPFTAKTYPALTSSQPRSISFKTSITNRRLQSTLYHSIERPSTERCHQSPPCPFPTSAPTGFCRQPQTKPSDRSSAHGTVPSSQKEARSWQQVTTTSDLAFRDPWPMRRTWSSYLSRTATLRQPRGGPRTVEATSMRSTASRCMPRCMPLLRPSTVPSQA